jgi:hypothetical protein
MGARVAIYWSMSSVPELAGLPRKQAARLFAWAYPKVWSNWQVWGGFLLYVAGGVGVNLAVATWAPPSWLPWGNSVYLPIFGFLHAQLVTHHARPLIAEKLLRARTHRLARPAWTTGAPAADRSGSGRFTPTKGRAPTPVGTHGLATERRRRLRLYRALDAGCFVVRALGPALAVGGWMIHPAVGLGAGLAVLLWFAESVQDARRAR